MSEQAHTLSPQTFDRIFALLISDEQFKQRFNTDPAQAVLDAGIPVSSEEASALRTTELRQRLKEMGTFDERLVLSSSAGY